MNQQTARMREIAKDLLEKKEVQMVIGWEKGTFFYNSTPVFITRPEDVDKLIWDDYCAINFAKLLMDYRYMDGKVAIFVKGCDTRGVNRLIQDLVIKRDKVYLIGMPCPGMKDAKVAAKLGQEREGEVPLESKCLPLKGLEDSSQKDIPINRGRIAQIIAAVHGLDYTVDESIMFMYLNNFSVGMSKTEMTINTYGKEMEFTRAAATAFMQKMSITTQIKDLEGNVIKVEPRKIMGLYSSK